MKIEVKNHPAQARNPMTNEPLWDSHGLPVPLFPAERSVYLEGRLVAYIGSPPKRTLMFIHPKERLGSYVVDRIREQVLCQTDHEVKHLVSVPEKIEITEDED